MTLDRAIRDLTIVFWAGNGFAFLLAGWYVSFFVMLFGIGLRLFWLGSRP